MGYIKFFVRIIVYFFFIICVEKLLYSCYEKKIIFMYIYDIIIVFWNVSGLVLCYIGGNNVFIGWKYFG